MKPDYVYDLKDCQFDEDFQMGVVISINKSKTIVHCGLAYNLSDGIEVLHLFNKIQHDCGKGRFMCIIRPSMNSIQQKAVTPLLEVIAQKVDNEKFNMPYGFKYDEYSYFDKENGFVLGKDTSGFTCATFVLTLFRTFGMELIDLESWPSRAEDSEWEIRTKQCCYSLKGFNDITREQILKMEKEIGSKRYCPHEVAVSSALHNGSPASADIIIKEGENLYDYLISMIDNNEIDG